MSTNVETALGKFVWHDHTSSDVDKAKSFYTELLGWELETWDPDGMNYSMIKQNGRNHGGFGESQGGAPRTGSGMSPSTASTRPPARPRPEEGASSPSRSTSPTWGGSSSSPTRRAP
jgi:catechol 2,3-dioxygenase-like lactoylglutathione lyase family enzyme